MRAKVASHMAPLGVPELGTEFLMPLITLSEAVITRIPLPSNWKLIRWFEEVLTVLISDILNDQDSIKSNLYLLISLVSISIAYGDYQKNRIYINSFQIGGGKGIGKRLKEYIRHLFIISNIILLI